MNTSRYQVLDRMARNATMAVGGEAATVSFKDRTQEENSPVSTLRSLGLLALFALLVLLLLLMTLLFAAEHSILSSGVLCGRMRDAVPARPISTIAPIEVRCNKYILRQ